MTHTDITAIAQIVALEVANRISATSTPGRWLTMQEAKDYAKVKSLNTIKKWVNEGLIYGRRRSAKGDWIIDRDSIDEFYLEEKIEIS